MRGRRVAGLLCCTAVVLSVTTACGGDPTRLAADVHHQAWSPGSPKAATAPGGTDVAAPGWVVGSASHRDIRQLTLSQLETRIRAAQARATSVHYVMNSTTPVAEHSDIHLDLVSGDFEMVDSEQGLSATIRRVASVIYLKGDSTYWTRIAAMQGKNPASVAYLANKWVEVPDQIETGIQLDDYARAGKPVDLLKLDRSAARLPDETVDGQRMLVLRVTSKQSGHRDKMYVPVTGDAYPTRIVAASGSDATIDYTFSTDHVTFSAPSGPDLVTAPPIT